MSARIALMSEDELAGLRSRIAQLTKMGNPDQRMASMRQLETIDVEMERRLAPEPRPVRAGASTEPARKCTKVTRIGSYKY